MSDNRRFCTECMHLTDKQQCIAGLKLGANKNYRPYLDLPRRCEAYKPYPEEPDQRLGWQRWPFLLQLRTCGGKRRK